MLKLLEGFFKHFTKNKCPALPSQTLLQGEKVCSVATCSQSNNPLVWILLPFSLFVLSLKCHFSFEVPITENIMLPVTGLVICKDIISIVQEDGDDEMVLFIKLRTR